MGDLTSNLSRSEFKCECCNFDTVDFDLVCALQDLVDYYGGYRNIMITITGPNRCKERNDLTEGAAPNSQHIYGRAADFRLYYRDNSEQISPIDIYEYLDDQYPDKYGLGLYNDRVHFDTRSGPKARWGN
jgi:uncharacterized protein YcbK (DUF882 family)